LRQIPNPLGAVRAQKKQREQRPLFARADLEPVAGLVHLERAEDAEAHRRVTPRPRSHLSTTHKYCTSGIQALVKPSTTCSGSRSRHGRWDEHHERAPLAGFHSADAGIGAAATVATAMLAVGLAIDLASTPTATAHKTTAHTDEEEK
jgi:hypothetical protein